MTPEDLKPTQTQAQDSKPIRSATLASTPPATRIRPKRSRPDAGLTKDELSA
ncbi:MAG: hypothetical protein WDN06_22500 [Asticcacaulis sp.]